MGDSTPVTTAVKPTNIRINNKGFTILQWNACGLTSMGHGDELKAFISNSTIIIDIICVQETWLFNKKKKKKPTSLATTFNINGYTSYYSSEGNTTRGGVGFLYS